MTMNSITARLNFNYHTRDSNQRTVFPGVAVNKAVVFYLKLETYFVYHHVCASRLSGALHLALQVPHFNIAREVSEVTI